MIALMMAATLIASPPSGTAPLAVTFTLNAPPSPSSFAAGPPVYTITFGDGSSGTITTTATHVYTAPGTYTATVVQVKASTTVTVTAPAARNTPTPAPTRAPPTAPTALQVQSVLTWPNGTTAIQLATGSGVPQPTLRLQSNASGTLIGQWTLDGAVLQQVTQTFNGAQSATVSYQPSLPSDGKSHTVGFTIVSPAQTSTPGPGITYAFSTGTVLNPSYQRIQFQGFTVRVGQMHVNQNGTYNGNGYTQIANLELAVTFLNVTLAPDPHDATLGDVTSGSTSLIGNGTMAPTPPKGSGGRTQMARRAGGGSIASTCSTQGFPQQIGTFTRDGYTFALMQLTLNQIGTPSTATLCYAPTNVEEYIVNVDGWNADFLTPQQQSPLGLQLELDLAQIDQEGQFDTSLTGKQVGSFRLGYTPFQAEPSATQLLNFKFADSDPAPHVYFDAAVQAYGLILQQMDFATPATVAPQMSFMPGGIDATFSISAGSQIHPGTLISYDLTINSATFAIANSAFNGGSMSGTFNTDSPWQSPFTGQHAFGHLDSGSASSGQTGSANQSATLRAYAGALQAAQAYNASASSSAAHSFTGNAILSRINPRNLPISTSTTGNFSGTFTSLGDLVANTSGVTDFGVSSYVIHVGGAQLFVPGGQTTTNTHGDFLNYMKQLLSGPSWSGTNIPQLDYSQPAQAVIHAVGGFIYSNLANILSGLSNQTQSQISGIHQVYGHYQIVANLGGAAQTTTPDFPYPGLNIEIGTIAMPIETSGAMSFDEKTSGQGWGFVFVDDGGTSGAVTLAGDVHTTFQQFPLHVQLMNLAFVDGVANKVELWATLGIPKPIDAVIPIDITSVDGSGNVTGADVPKGVKIPLTGWNSAVFLVSTETIGNSKVPLNAAIFAHTGGPILPIPVNGALDASGSVDNHVLNPAIPVPMQVIAGLNYQTTAYDLPDDGAGNAQPLALQGFGSVPGWANGKQVTLNATNNGFAPPSGYSFGISQSIGVADFNANIGYDNGTWKGRGQMSSSVVTATFGFNVNDQTEHGWIGTNVGQADGGSSGDGSSNGVVPITDIAGQASFNRSDGSLIALAVGADLNVSSIQGGFVALYHTSPDSTDPVVANLGGTRQLDQRGWNSQCASGWCFDGNAKIGLDSSDRLEGEIDLAFAPNGASVYAGGTLYDPLDTIGAYGQGEFYTHPTSWDIGLAINGIPIFGVVTLSASGCVWDHRGGHVDSCLSTGYTENSYGFYVSGSATANLGPIASASVGGNVAWNGSNGFSAGVNANGSVNFGVASANVGLNANFSIPPPQFTGGGYVNVCLVESVQVSGNVQVTINDNGVHLDKGGISFGTCGALGWL